MNHDNYLVATIKPWNIKVYNDVIKHYKGNWHLITEPSELTVDKIKLLNPKYIFFPHWSEVVPTEVLEIATCVCFHETDLPYGRGGSPLQNLIAKGHRETVVSAIKMSKDLDTGPVYLKMPLSLEGIAEEIFIRTANIVAEMIKIIITENPIPQEQIGESVFFRRRKPNESKLPIEKNDLVDLFDHIRMLDAERYPKAFLKQGEFRFEFSRPSLKTDEIIADVRITKIKGNDND